MILLVAVGHFAVAMVFLRQLVGEAIQLEKIQWCYCYYGVTEFAGFLLFRRVATKE